MGENAPVYSTLKRLSVSIIFPLWKSPMPAQNPVQKMAKKVADVNLIGAWTNQTLKMEPSAEVWSPFSPFLTAQGCVILDGGMATELENQGESILDSLWSFKVMLEKPHIIKKVE